MVSTDESTYPPTYGGPKTLNRFYKEVLFQADQGSYQGSPTQDASDRSPARDARKYRAQLPLAADRQPSHVEEGSRGST